MALYRFNSKATHCLTWRLPSPAILLSKSLTSCFDNNQKSAIFRQQSLAGTRTEDYRPGHSNTDAPHHYGQQPSSQSLHRLPEAAEGLQDHQSWPVARVWTLHPRGKQQESWFSTINPSSDWKPRTLNSYLGTSKLDSSASTLFHCINSNQVMIAHWFEFWTVQYKWHLENFIDHQSDMIFDCRLTAIVAIMMRARHGH